MSPSILESSLDLSITGIAEPGPGLLVATSRMTTARALVAAVLGLVCLGMCAYVWRHRANWLQLIWPLGALIPVLGAVSLVLALGHHSKSFNAETRTLLCAARLGPFSSSKSYALPASGTVEITYRRVQGSRASGKSMPSTLWYDVSVAQVPAAGFSIASDREAARAFARTLAEVLRYSVVDKAEDDGVERP